MNITREHVKETTGMVAMFGGGALTGVSTGVLIKALPNPIMKVAAYVAAMGLSVIVGKAAKDGTDQIVDSVCDIVDVIKNRDR